MPTLVLVANRLVFANRAARAVLGYEDTPPRDLLGRDAAGFIAPRDRAVTAKGVARLLTTGLPACNVPRLLVHRDGCEVLAICAASMIRWRGRPALVVGFMVLSGVPELGAEPDGMPHLSPRERQVARLVARGVRTGEIARTLGLRESTVRAHLKAVYRKADCHSRVELTQLVLGLQRQP